MLYTSGTTSKPKGVVTTHAQLAAQIASLVEAWEWTAADRTLHVLPLHHIHGIVNVSGLCPLVGWDVRDDAESSMRRRSGARFARGG